eukprot:COSAG01_NODE_4316_length_5136_cov_2.864087_2_plen_103_part_00
MSTYWAMQVASVRSPLLRKMRRVAAEGEGGCRGGAEPCAERLHPVTTTAYLFERDRIARSHAIGQLGGLALPNFLQELDEVRDALHVAHQLLQPAARSRRRR